MSTPWIVLSTSVCFRVYGKDSRRYLHNRLSHDIRALAPGQSVLAAALSAQGRVEGLFTVFCEAEDRFVLVCDGGDATTLESALKRFVVADRVTCEEITKDICVVHLAADEARVRQVLEGASLQASAVAPRARVSSVGVDLIFTAHNWEAIVRLLHTVCGEELSREQYARMRWQMGCAVYPDEINERGIVLEYDIRQAVSFTKGCYVGQEVVERSDAIGKVPRQLERIVLDGSAAVEKDASVSAAGGEALGMVVGAVTSPAEDQMFLFALLRTGKYKGGDKVVCAGRHGVIVQV
jgi:folate-binding protein YgfZ